MESISLNTKYIVPFSYDSVQFDELQSKEDWNIFDQTTEMESDLYEYVRRSFITSRNDKDSDHSTKIGCLYEYQGKLLPGNFRLKFVNGKTVINFYIRHVYLALFQTGIGFMWFEPELRSGFNSVEEAIEFNYLVKEMARDERSNYLYYEQILDIIGNEVIPEESIISGGKKYKKDESFYLGAWIDDIARSICKNIYYYPSRAKTIDNVKRPLPDKFVLFQYGLIYNNENVEKTMIYLARGYKESYLLPEGYSSELCKPFGNVRYYAASEGCGYFVISDEHTPDFFKSGMTKIGNDYFIMYLLALYQNYTLLRYSELISNKLSSDRDDYKCYSRELEESLDDLTTELNIFLAKSVYSSVSHIQHQNIFFNYVSDRLLIRENINSVTSGIEALNNIESCLYEEEIEKKNKYLNICLTVVSFLALFSAFNDINEFLNNHIYRLFPETHPYLTYFLNGALAFITVIILGNVIQYIIYDPDRKKKKKEKRRKM